jgi:hypothetical protein
MQRFYLILPIQPGSNFRKGQGAYVMEAFLIVLAVIAAAGVVLFLFVIEPRRKIYDYDPLDPR